MTYVVVLAVTALALLCSGQVRQPNEASLGVESLSTVTEYSGISASERDRLLVQANPRIVPGLRQHRSAFDRNPSANGIAPDLSTPVSTARGPAFGSIGYAALLHDVVRTTHLPRAPPGDA